MHIIKKTVSTAKITEWQQITSRNFTEAKKLNSKFISTSEHFMHVEVFLISNQNLKLINNS